MKNRFKLALTSLAALGLSACANTGGVGVWAPPQFPKATPTDVTLMRLPPPDKKIAVAVYGFTDQTGQFKPSDNIQTLSRAITQGGSSILIKALQDAGNRQWFQIIERERLDDLLRERSVIREMRSTYLGESGINPHALPPLMFAGVILEGGVISYDSNTKTGGLGARFLGIGGNTSYREDTVTVYLRAVSTKTGEVLLSVNSRKSIASIGLSTNTFRYVGFQDLLEIDGGVTSNEPSQLALQQAIEKAVYGLVMEGAEQRLWCFSDTQEAVSDLIRHHIADRDHIKFEDAKLPVDLAGHVVTGACANGAATASLIEGGNLSVNGKIEQPAAVAPLPQTAPREVASSIVPQPTRRDANQIASAKPVNAPSPPAQKETPTAAQAPLSDDRCGAARCVTVAGKS